MEFLKGMEFSLRQIRSGVYKDYITNERLSLCEASNRTKGQPTVIIQSIVFFGIVLLSTGVWCCSQASDPFPVESQVMVYRVPGRTMMFQGSLLLALGTVTIFVAASMPRLILLMLMQSLYPLFLLEAVAGGTAMALISTVRAGSLERALVRQVAGHGPHSRLTVALDALQRQHRCCGARGPGDWARGPPPACCGQDDADDCSLHKCTEGNPRLATKGCAEVVSPLLLSHLHSVILCAFVCLFLHHSLFLVVMHLDRNL